MPFGISELGVGNQVTIAKEDLMARAIWTGSVAFGLVNVPVGLFAATEDRTVHFNQFQEGTSDRIRYKRVNERTGREVGLDHIVRGHEVGDGDYVLLGDEELEAAEPGRSRTVDITDFVDLAEIDPIYYQKSYYLGPRNEEAARPYALLHRAMADTGKAGIATLVMHGKQHLATIRAAEPNVLVLETMFFADEVRDAPDVIENLPSDETFRGRELTIAKQLIESMTTGWDPANYRDTYRERVEDLIKRKQRGEEIVTEGGGAPEDSNVTDLMDALRRSAEEMRGRGGGAGRGESRRKEQPKGRASSGSRTRPSRASSKTARKSKAAATDKPKGASRSGRKAG
jgi:DNA end-binding protein Ku